MKAAIFDYGAGNLHSLEKALTLSGATVSIHTDARDCLDADVLVLPGVGAFGLAAERLAPARDEVRKALQAGMPAIGICLGMHLFFESSTEGAGAGLGIAKGRVERLTAAHVPHIGWNRLEGYSDPLPGDGASYEMYYANSYAARPADSGIVTAWTRHDEDRFPAMVRIGRAIGMQFHPEKSSAPGVRLLAAALAECVR